MDELADKSSMIKAEARRLGFDGCGISHAEKLSGDSVHLKSWLGKKFHAGMAYMENHTEMRVDPSLLVDNAQSVISVILNYFTEKRQDKAAPVVSKYAYGQDYHDVIRKKLRQLLTYISLNVEPASGRAFVDSAPVLDRAWAARAGLGWIGKNSNLISPETGSFFFIGSLVIDIPLYYDKPIPDFCGDCNRCLIACPTGAIVSPRVIDSGRCISYLTIENKGEIGNEFRESIADRVFGCDICQDVCPWNRKAIPHKVKELEPLPGLLEMARADWYTLDETTFKSRFAKSAIKRAKFAGIKRNLDFLQQKELK